MKTFELLTKLAEEKAGKEEQVNKAVERLGEAEGKLSELQDKHKALAYKAAKERKDLTKEIDKVLDEIAKAKAVVDSRKFELSVVQEVEQATDYTEDSIQAEFFAYRAEFTAEVIKPSLDKLAEAKQAYLEALKGFETARNFLNEQASITGYEVNKRVKDKGRTVGISGVSTYEVHRNNPASFLTAEEIKPKGL